MEFARIIYIAFYTIFMRKASSNVVCPSVPPFGGISFADLILNDKI